MLESRRGQSEVIGLVLLTAIIVSVVTIAAVFIFDKSADRESETDRALTDLQLEMNGTHLLIRHAGGDPLDTSRTFLVVNDTVQYLDGADEATGASDGEFTPGEELYFLHNASGKVEVKVVSEVYNEVLTNRTFRLPS